MQLLFADLATSALAGAISNIATSCALTTGSGALFPQVGVDQYFKAVLTDQATGNVHEIVHVTGISGDTITSMVRGQEGTQGLAWNAGDLFQNLHTAGAMFAVAQMPSSAGNPNGVHAGQAATPTQSATQIWDTVNNLVWICIVSGNATGAVWVSPEQQLISRTPFGAFVNKFRNASCLIAQRGTSIVVSPGSPVYTLDGFIVGCTGASVTVSQGPSIGQGPNSIMITGQAGVTGCWITMPIESVDAFALALGSVLFQTKLLNNTGAPLQPTITVKYPTASDTWATSTILVNAQPLPVVQPGSTGLLVYSFGGVIGIQNGASVRIDLGSALAGAGRSVSFGDLDIRTAGNQIVTAPVPEIRAYSLELLQCQRYLPGLFPRTAGHAGSGGYFSSANSGAIDITFKTQTRTFVTGVTLSATSDWNINAGGNVWNVSGWSFNGSTAEAGSINFTGASGTGGYTPAQGHISGLISANANARLFFTGAELNGAGI